MEEYEQLPESERLRRKEIVDELLSLTQGVVSGCHVITVAVKEQGKSPSLHDLVDSVCAKAEAEAKLKKPG